MKYLKLIRWPNLLIILFIGISIRYFILGKIIELSFPSEMLSTAWSTINFILLMISVMAIAASGYVINDVSDVKTDKINKPGKNMIPYEISVNQATNFHHILNFIGIGIGIYLSLQLEQFALAIFFILPAVLLRLYSTNLSRMFLVGNFVIAFLGAILIYSLGFFEIYSFNKKYFNLLYYNNLITPEYHPATLMLTWLKGYAIFSFILTLIREIIKDTEDMEGDRFVGAKTLPLKLGIKGSKVIVICLSMITIIGLTYLSNTFMTEENGFYYAFEYSSFISALMIALIYLCVKAQDKAQFNFMSKFSKIIMLVGIFYMITNFIFFKSPFL